MKKWSWWIWLPLALVGCQPSSTPTATAPPPEEAEPVSATVNLSTPEMRMQHARELSTQLAEVSRKASAAQAAFDFPLAARQWRTAEKILLQLYGPGVWQVRNATESALAAEAQASMNQDQLAQLKRLQGLQQKIAEALASQQIPTAVELSRQAAVVSQELFPRDSYLWGKQALQLGRLEQMNRNFPTAIRHYREAVLVLQQRLGEPHPDLEILHGFLGECFVAQQELTRAVENFKVAAKFSRELWGEDSLEYAVRANDLGVAFHKLHDLETATKILRAAEMIRRKKLGADHPLVAHSLYNLAIVYIDLQRYEMAEQCLGQAVAVFEAKNPQEPLLLECQAKWATTLMLLDRPERAEQLLQGLLTAQQSRAADASTLALTKYRLAISMAKQRKFAAAEPLLLEALQQQEVQLGPTNSMTVRTKNALATLYFQTDRKELAERLASEVKTVSYQSQEENAFQR